VDWESGAVHLLTEHTDWPTLNRPRRAAISSFGFGGTNAHVIVEEAESVPASGDGSSPDAVSGEAARRPLPAVPWLLSGRTSQALGDQARKLLALVGDGDGPAELDVAYSLAATRARFEHRSVVVGSDREELVAGLRALAEGRPAPTVVTTQRTRGRTAFLFSGQGAQRPGMGRDLYATYPAFATALDHICTHLDPLLPQPLKPIMFAPQDTPQAALLNQTGFTQPALFAFQTALFRLLESWGITPDHLTGHSIGELTAAHVAGILNLPDAATLVAARAQLMQALPTGGIMTAIQATEEEITTQLANHHHQASIAAINGPTSIVLSGDTTTVQNITAHFTRLGRRTRQRTVSHAFHSPHMDTMLEDFRTTAKNITYQTPHTPITSTLTGHPTTNDDLRTPDYWTNQVRQTVRFADAITTLHNQGTTTYLEIGPDSVLTALTHNILSTQSPTQPDATTAIPAIRDTPEPHALTRAVGTLHTRGIEVDWETFYAHTGAHQVELPTYAFQQQRYWLQSEVPRPVPAQDALFRVQWVEADPPAPVKPQRWAILAPAEYMSDALPEAPRFTHIADIGRAVSSGARFDAVLLPFLFGDAVDGPHYALELVQEWLAEQQLADVRLVVLTSGAVAVTEEEGVPDLGAAAALGLLRSAQSEAPGRIVLVDGPSVTGSALSAVVASGETQVSVREGTVLTPRLVTVPGRGSAGPVWDGAGTVLVTGGTGWLGGLFARHLVAEHGVRHLLLAGRRGERADGMVELVDELTGLGAKTVTVESCDVSEKEALAGLLAGIPGDRPLTGVVHTAGALDNALLAEQNPERLDNALRPKADGAWHLHELTRDLDISAFVMFSSVAGIFGAPGQANYAAANAFLDALAQHRAALGLPATSIAWGLYNGGINAALTERDLSRFVRDGLLPVTEDEGRALFDRALSSGVAALVASPSAPAGDRAGDGPALLRDLTGGRADHRRVPDASGTVSLAERLAELPEAQREQHVLATVAAVVAAVLGHSSPAAITPDRPFQELGFDSLTGVELRNRLGADTGVRLPATLVFDHPNPAALATYLLAEAAPRGVDPAGAVHEELDRLEVSLAALGDDNEARSAVSARMRTLLAEVTGSESATTTTDAVTDRIASASADEIFDFIDTQLGRSAG
ncbi:SDR family NAD(P)-dependent oxidoreductase, partial [Streptomyces sp. NPDC002870]|uniref:SDR family NAD(P)-dependent oxidoreductase n=1 Tax=Streptomyces sp. NPDC002870 TaxID=3364666 RepID=UPI0036CF42ED